MKKAWEFFCLPVRIKCGRDVPGEEQNREKERKRGRDKGTYSRYYIVMIVGMDIMAATRYGKHFDSDCWLNGSPLRIFNFLLALLSELPVSMI
jgi:hypothetical protein